MLTRYIEKRSWNITSIVTSVKKSSAKKKAFEGFLNAVQHKRLNKYIYIHLYLVRRQASVRWRYNRSVRWEFQLSDNVLLTVGWGSPTWGHRERIKRGALQNLFFVIIIFISAPFLEDHNIRTNSSLNTLEYDAKVVCFKPHCFATVADIRPLQKGGQNCARDQR